MPRTGERGGPQTRARISEAASWLFLERGFDAVTVAEIAAEAGVSSVTVFKHFPRKEDLFLDRQDDAAELLRSAVRDAGEGGVRSVLDALEAMTLRLVDERAPMSGLAAGSVRFFETVAAAPSLVARAREIGADLQGVLTEELAGRPRGELLAALVIAGYSTVLVATAHDLMAGVAVDAVADRARGRLRELFGALREGFQGE